MDVQIDEHNVAPATRAPEVVVVDDQDQEDEEDKDQVHLTVKGRRSAHLMSGTILPKKLRL